MTRALTTLVDRFLRARDGSVGLIFSLLIVPLIAVAGAGYDFAAISVLKSQLQAAADAGALRAAGELRLAKGGHHDLTPVARPPAQNVLARSAQSLRDVHIEAALVESNSAVRVSVQGTYDPKVVRLLYKEPVRLAATAIARANGFPICALGLEPSASHAVYLEANAKVTAQYCAVHSNSTNPEGLSGGANSFLKAGMICSAGGKYGGKSNFEPDPLTDCPVVPDPLAQRAPPPVGPCAHTDERIDGGTITLTPGVYCGGLTIIGASSVTLSPGIYVMKDGPLLVDGGSSFKATGVGVYLTGANAVFNFSANTSVSMTAPNSGPMAGMLFFEDPTAPGLREHKILSDNASVLLGTIYLPKGRLEVETNKPVGKQSAFTIIVAQRMELYGGSELVLNSDYASTSVPVPGGLNAGRTYLIK